MYTMGRAYYGKSTTGRAYYGQIQMLNGPRCEKTCFQAHCRIVQLEQLAKTCIIFFQERIAKGLPCIHTARILCLCCKYAKKNQVFFWEKSNNNNCFVQLFYKGPPLRG